MSLRPRNPREKTTAGVRNRIVRLERFGVTYNQWNEPIEGWALLAETWASKDDVSDGEKLRAAQVGASVTTRFVVLYDDIVAGLTATDRLFCEGREYSITGVKEIGTREGIEITAATGIDTQVLSAEAPANEDDSQG